MRNWKPTAACLAMVLAAGWALGTVASGGDAAKAAARRTMKVGWVIGSDTNETAVILHTVNGGKTWSVQGDNSQWQGYWGSGISASNDRHAAVVGSWAVGVPESVPLGVILKTSDGGKSWTNQPLPVDNVAFWKVSFVGAWR